MRSIEIMQSRIEGEVPDATLVTVTPKSDAMGPKLRDFAAGRRFIADGAEAAEAALPRITAALPWLDAQGDVATRHLAASRVAGLVTADRRASVRTHGANGFATPSSACASCGKCRRSTDRMELSSIHSIPAWVYTFGV